LQHRIRALPKTQLCGANEAQGISISCCSTSSSTRSNATSHEHEPGDEQLFGRHPCVQTLVETTIATEAQNGAPSTGRTWEKQTGRPACDRGDGDGDGEGQATAALQGHEFGFQLLGLEDLFGGAVPLSTDAALSTSPPKSDGAALGKGASSSAKSPIAVTR